MKKFECTLHLNTSIYVGLFYFILGHYYVIFHDSRFQFCTCDYVIVINFKSPLLFPFLKKFIHIFEYDLQY
jgi:hypothetical protein